MMTTQAQTKWHSALDPDVLSKSMIHPEYLAASDLSRNDSMLGMIHDRVTQVTQGVSGHHPISGGSKSVASTVRLPVRSEYDRRTGA